MFFPYSYFNVVTVAKRVLLFCFPIILQGDHVCMKQITGQQDAGKSITSDQALFMPCNCNFLLQLFQRKVCLQFSRDASIIKTKILVKVPSYANVHHWKDNSCLFLF